MRRPDAKEISNEGSLVLTGGVLFDGTGRAAEADSVILIERGVIAAVGKNGCVPVPKSARVIDASGGYLIPGLIDAHIHYESPRDLLQLLAWGVTSANCMFESTVQAQELEEQTAPAGVPSARIYATAPMFSTRDGWWSGEGFPDDPIINRFPATPGDARTQMEKVKATTGIKRVKLMYDDMRWCRDPHPPLARMKREIMEALLDEAQRQGLFAEIHVPQYTDALEVLNAGCLFAFAHGILDRPLDGGFIDAMKERQAMYVTTFSVFEFLADVEWFLANALADRRFRRALSVEILRSYESDEYSQRYIKRYPHTESVGSHLPTLRQNMLTLFRSGIPVVMGTDMWAFQGIGAHLELEYMVQAGLTPAEALTAATSGGAQFLDEFARLGTIEPGKRADMLLLDANPLDDIRNTRSIRLVLKQGWVYDHLELVERSKQ